MQWLMRNFTKSIQFEVSGPGLSRVWQYVACLEEEEEEEEIHYVHTASKGL